MFIQYNQFYILKNQLVGVGIPTSTPLVVRLGYVSYEANPFLDGQPERETRDTEPRSTHPHRAQIHRRIVGFLFECCLCEVPVECRQPGFASDGGFEIACIVYGQPMRLREVQDRGFIALRVLSKCKLVRQLNKAGFKLSLVYSIATIRHEQDASNFKLKIDRCNALLGMQSFRQNRGKVAIRPIWT